MFIALDPTSKYVGFSFGGKVVTLANGKKSQADQHELKLNLGGDLDEKLTPISEPTDEQLKLGGIISYALQFKATLVSPNEDGTLTLCNVDGMNHSTKQDIETATMSVEDVQKLIKGTKATFLTYTDIAQALGVEGTEETPPSQESETEQNALQGNPTEVLQHLMKLNKSALLDVEGNEELPMQVRLMAQKLLKAHKDNSGAADELLRLAFRNQD